jgi:hypothetical protein
MQVDPNTATSWLASRAGTTEAETLAVADGWIRNGTGLQECIDQLPDAGWKQNFLADLGSEMSVQNPSAAVKLAQQMNPGDSQVNLLKAVACNWITTDPTTASDWVASVKDSSLREQLIASSAQSYALTDPARAATWLVSEVKSDAIMQDAALNILKIWVVKNPAQAASWASQFPDGNIRAAAVQIVSQYWQQTDRVAATAWIQNLSGESQSSQLN